MASPSCDAGAPTSIGGAGAAANDIYHFPLTSRRQDAAG